MNTLRQIKSRSFFHYCLVPALTVLLAMQAGNLKARPLATPLEGRWDITVDMDGKPAPSWLEVTHSGTRTLVGRFVSVSGSARPISEVHFKDGTFNFSIPPQWESGDGQFSVQGTVQGDQMKGTLTTPSGKTHNWTGVRAPALRRTSAPSWGKPVKLTEGNTLKGWHASTATNQWTMQNGVLKSEKSGANLITDEKYDDFKLHVEFRIPKGSNSGVYLRGRYEVQVTDGKGLQPSVGELGGVYGFIAPSEMVAKEPGEWQSFDVTLIGRMITLDVNGQRVITNQEIPGITGGALDSNEGEPGPLYIQGDHGPVEYRNIILTPGK
ncbi:DUF1080 domain-containing protein [Rhabdobacter roseus]|uniref:3-keto-alpha-glucoside-1,2-lyase/3-keto-2-hydroxy-glucal hydratase domain-containing protein n=1 Tax=Rhabdobacter roseus TaxID=1655419 RepID=A0A840U5A3_9BACT|nr:DUF1080 domain-containing protein [Rhabdobacter roseus]MBB5287260.1 hypothetical protein [Rhabdobacter roseus]